MSAAAAGPVAAQQQRPAYPPINYFYTHFHNSIRGELESLAAWVRGLDAVEPHAVPAMLLELRERYRFLEQVYKYHSSVEDEVRGAALPGALRRSQCACGTHTACVRDAKLAGVVPPGRVPRAGRQGQERDAGIQR
jgi:hypothetical protein